MTSTVTKNRVCLGRPSDFEKTNKVIQEYKVVKTGIIKTLLTLADEAEGLVIQKINEEMTSTGVLF